ncbi:hypothetical protein [Roseateles sp.]|uniref:hypothetical protein n=1 Tax=Roseateles sp. TaxID=1971397 RepID=UPI003263ED32
MNRTQHLTSSRPRPEHRMERPGASSLCVIPNTALAANDGHMGPADEPAKGFPALADTHSRCLNAEVSPAMSAPARERVAAMKSGKFDKASAASISRFRHGPAGEPSALNKLSLLIERGQEKSTGDQRGVK